jgi:hypothetical protein
MGETRIAGVVGHDHPGGETRATYSARPEALVAQPDPIAGLIRQLDHAASCCGSIPRRDGSAVQVARVAGGYAIGPRR